jgi:hypothetical protein
MSGVVQRMVRGMVQEMVLGRDGAVEDRCAKFRRCSERASRLERGEGLDHAVADVRPGICKREADRS